MITLGGAQNIYLATGATDLRKSFVGLHALIRDQLKRSRPLLPCFRAPH
jgi:hypothetical protein